MKYSEQLITKLKLANDDVNSMVDNVKQDIIKLDLQWLVFVQETLNELYDTVLEKKNISKELEKKYKHLLTISVRAFEGQPIDKLLWEINGLLFPSNGTNVLEEILKEL